MLVPLCLILGLTVWLTVHYSKTPDLIWTAIDVNSQNQQGDAHLLQINQRINILIDTGHRLYSEKLLQFLKDRNITRLNAVIISHGHSDHYGGLVFLLRNNIRVDSVYFNPPAIELIHQEWWGCNTAEIEEIQHECMRRNIPITPMTDKTVWLFDNDISLKVLYIYNGIDTPIGKTDINDTSAIIMLTHRDIKILFAGDLNRSLGNYVTKRNDIVPLKANILKVPHHGGESLPLKNFFEVVNPDVMVVPTTTSLWQSDRCQRVRTLSKNCQTYVNGLNGDITIKFYGDSYHVETQLLKNQPVSLEYIQNSR